MLKVVAIDGPSGAGKSTVARALATRLGWSYIDTGAMYRSVGLKADRLGVALDDDQALAGLCADTRIDLVPDPSGGVQVLLDGEDVSAAIREHRVSDLASRVSARRPVRDAMGRYQRQLGERRPAVLEGRDVGTVVFPDAAVKIFLTATAEERARRRTAELNRRGQPAAAAAVLADICARDRQDSTREHAPLRRADDAVAVDTTGLDIDGVVQRLIEIVENVVGRAKNG
ncbi:MAG: (d)CMP kinase [Deferrisomatales bacterium]|nr:(d)CMP kinase [Deferrisomatales bacterium]